MFKDVKFMSAKQKENAWKNFKKIIDKRDISLLKKPLYEHLHVHCGFIAHYNIHGFREEYSGQNFRRFIEHFDKNHYYNQPPYLNFLWVGERDYADINTQIADYVTAQAQQIYGELDEAQKDVEVELMYTLAEKHGLTKAIEAKPVKPKQCNIFDMVASA